MTITSPPHPVKFHYWCGIVFADSAVLTNICQLAIASADMKFCYKCNYVLYIQDMFPKLMNGLKILGKVLTLSVSIE